MKLRHISAVAVLTILLPFAASAITVDELQQQISNLLKQIAQLQQQLKQLQEDDISPVACTMEAKICPDGTAVGRSGPKCEFAACPGETKPVPPVVPVCPQILRTLDQGVTGPDVKEVQAYLGVSQTGYFGPMTAKAVAALQAEEGLSQVGIIGPQTRAAFARRCGWDGTKPTPGNSFSASPTSGASPLSVVFRANIFNDLDSYSIDFGDGTSGTLQNNCSLGYCACGLPTVTHTYTSNGTYIAKLMYQPPFVCNAPPGAACAQMMPLAKQVGTATITVRGTTSTGAPSINSIDGPASLAVGESGTWTVHALVADDANAQLRYSVVWGDEGILAQLNAFAGATASTLRTSGSFTHVYARAGTYRPAFTVSNDSGSSQTSASVVVGKDTPLLCPKFMPPLCNANEMLVGGGYGTDGCQLSPRCVPKTSASDTFSASPTSGPAPLTVVFSAAPGGNINPSSYTIDFGDGASGKPVFPMCNIGGTCTGQVTHTYASNGTFNATLKKIIGVREKYDGGDTNIYEIVGTVTITVGALWL